jgi:hypothetical protein
VTKLERDLLLEMHMAGTAKTISNKPKAERRKIIDALAERGYLDKNGVTRKAVQELRPCVND